MIGLESTIILRAHLSPEKRGKVDLAGVFWIRCMDPRDSVIGSRAERVEI